MDEPNYIDTSLKRAELIMGRTPTPEEFSTEFAKVDPLERVAHMEQMEADLARETYATPADAARQFGHVNALRSTHRMLQKIGR